MLTTPAWISASQAKTIAADFLRDRDQQRMKGYNHGYLLYPSLSSAEELAARL